MPYTFVLVAHLASIVLAGPPLVSAAAPKPRQQTSQTHFEKRLGVWVGDPGAGGGVLVVEVMPHIGAPTLREGDLLIEFNGESLRDGEQFARLLEHTGAGGEIQLTLLRADERRQVPVS